MKTKMPVLTLAVLLTVFLACFHPGRLAAQTLSLAYSTYLSGGGDYTEGHAIVVDTFGCAYVAGWTTSDDFPTLNPYQPSQDGSWVAFVSKLSSTGSALLYSTYLGGSDWDYGYGISVENGLAYVTGEANSNNFPTVNSYQSSLEGLSDAFVSKLSSTGSALLYSTYLGGSDSEAGVGISVENGLAYVTGDTYSDNFPTVNSYQSNLEGFSDAFVSKFSSTGSMLLYSTYLGGDNFDWCHGISVENSLAYVAGHTWSVNFPTLNPCQSSSGEGWYAYDAFVSKLSSTGSELLYSTYLGGSNSDDCGGISVENGLAYVTGETWSDNFPTLNAYQSNLEGFSDAFVSKFSSTGSTLLYSTYLGGSLYEYGYGIFVENSLAYVTGMADSDNFPIRNPYQSSLEGTYDVFVSKLSSTGSALLYSTYLGGSYDDYGYGIFVGNSLVYVTGMADSDNFPTSNPYQASSGVGTAAFVSRLNFTTLKYLVLDSGDYNGDGTSDIAIFRGSSGMWSVRNFTRAYFGTLTDSLVPADYNGDGTTDIAIFRQSTGMWSVRSLSRFYLGISGDVPVPGDYVGNGTATAGLFRASGGMWAIRNVTRAYFGSTGDSVVPGYYNPDDSKDIAIFRGSTGMWSVRGVSRFYFGAATDDLVPGDYNGMGKWEGGIFRPSTGMWSIRNISRFYLGNSTDQPVPADYNGNGTDDAGIFRDSSGMWAIRNLSRVYFGSTNDIPVTR